MPRLSKISIKPRWGRQEGRPFHKGYLFVQAVPQTTKQAFKAMTNEQRPPETIRDAAIKLLRFYVVCGGKVPDRETWKAMKQCYEKQNQKQIALALEHKVGK